MATILQKKVFNAVVNGSEKITKAMSKAGYAISTSKRTNKVTRTKGWQELMDKFLPDKDLAKVHKELLNKREINLVRKKGDTGEEVYDVLDQPDTQAAGKALDMAYKLKSKYPQEPEGGHKTLIINITGETAKRYGLTPSSDTEDSRAGST